MTYLDWKTRKLDSFTQWPLMKCVAWALSLAHALAIGSLLSILKSDSLEDQLKWLKASTDLFIT